MRVQTNAKTLADALAVLKRYAGTSSPFPAADWAELRVPDGGGVLIVRRYATKTATDASASMPASGGDAGVVHVNADALAAAVKGANGTLMLAVADGEHAPVLTLHAENISAELRTEKSADFPAPIAFAPRPFAEVTDGERDALRGVLRAAAKGYDARAVLTGVNFDAENGEAVTTDTYRMHAARLRNVHASGIFPADVLGIAAATADAGGMELHADEDVRRFLLTYRVTKGGKKSPRVVAVAVYGHFTEGPFPNYAAIVDPAREAPDAITWTVMDASGTADAFRSFANVRNTPVILEAAGSAVHATVTLPDGGGTREAYPAITTDGRDDALASIAFNPSFAAEAAEHAGDGARVLIRDGLRAAYFDGGDRYALLMPMRVS